MQQTTQFFFICLHSRDASIRLTRFIHSGRLVIIKQKIFIITTGGTIEKSYDEEKGVLVNQGSHLQEMLKRLRLPYIEIQHQALLCKDSLDMSEQDRQIIRLAIENHLEKETFPIVILHGTDTMELTALHLYQNLTPSVPVILTGAMKPFGFENSDALQNFTESLLAAQLLSSGIYICMHGKVHQMPGVRKSKELKTFIKNE
jgi:L-asparaginase